MSCLVGPFTLLSRFHSRGVARLISRHILYATSMFVSFPLLDISFQQNKQEGFTSAQIASVVVAVIVGLIAAGIVLYIFLISGKKLQRLSLFDSFPSPLHCSICGASRGARVLPALSPLQVCFAFSPASLLSHLA